MYTVFARLRALRRKQDAGFSLVEVLVAIGVFGMVAVFAANSLAAGMRGALLGKRREVAIQEASRILEVARSLSYDELGLAQDDPTLSGDTAIVTQSGTKKYNAGAGVYEPIVYAVNPTGNPFNPHTSTVARAATDLTYYVYVSAHDADTDGVMDFKRVVVRVTWASSGTPGPTNEVRSQSFAHPGGFVTSPAGASGSGSTSGVTPMTATANAQALTASVSSARGTLDPPVDAVLPEDPVVLVQPKTAGSSTFRAVSQVACTAESGYLQGASGTYGQHPVVSSADDDSLTATVSQPPDQSWTGAPPDLVGSSDDVDALLVQPTISSTASCHATAEDHDGLDPADDDLPYGTGTAASSATLQLAQDATDAGLPASAVTVLETGAHSATQTIDHALYSDVRETLATAAYQMTGTTRAFVVPDVIPDGLVKIDPLSVTASVVASPATPSAFPSLNAPDGMSIWLFDPSAQLTGCSERSGDYCRVTLDPDSGTYTGASIESSGSVAYGQTTLNYTISVQSMPPLVGVAAGDEGPNGEHRWKSSFAPLSVSTTLVVRVNDVNLTSSTLDLQLGSVTADGCAGVACS